jgi:exosortase H (IPTLxxWG-CTERM-specific)
VKSGTGRSKKGNQKTEKRRTGISVRRFLVTYLALMVVFFFFTSFKPIVRIVDVNGFFAQFVSAASSKIVCLLHDRCTSHGSVITLPGLSLNVEAACSGLDAVMMYAVAVLAYPADWKKKIVGILSGFVVIQAANLLRIVALSYIGVYMKSVFEFVHIYIAQGVMIALALGIFLIYLSNANRPETEHN